MNTDLTKHLDMHQTQIEKARAFLDTYGDKIPDGLGHFYIDRDFAMLTINLIYQPDSQRQRALQAAGDIFGRTGWVATPDITSGKQVFNWSKTVDDVRLMIYNAEELPKPEEMPVPPQKFPLQLEDAA